MMNVDSNAIAFGVVGLAVGSVAYLWNKKRGAEERCEFLSYANRDLRRAFKAADRVLANNDTPEVVRMVLLHLLAAFSDEEKGRAFALRMIDPPRKPKPSKAENPLAAAMIDLAESNRALASDAHRAMMSLSFSLTFLHLADHIKVEKVTSEAARDPSSIWVRIWRLLGLNGDGPGASPMGQAVGHC